MDGSVQLNKNGIEMTSTTLIQPSFYNQVVKDGDFECKSGAVAMGDGEYDNVAWLTELTRVFYWFDVPVPGENTSVLELPAHFI